MFEAMSQILNFAGTDLRAGNVQRDRPAECELRFFQPFQRRFAVAFEQ